MLAPFALSLLAASLSGATAADPADAPTRPPAGEAAVIARLFDRGLTVGDPFPTRDAVALPSRDENAAKARSIVALAAAARARALDRSPDVASTLEALRQILLAEKLMQSMTDTIVIDEAEVRRTFDASPDKYDEFEMAHIFLSSDRDRQGGGAAALARASAVQARLKAGEDFGAVAASASDDSSSAAQGGVLPAILGANIQPVFLDTVRTMKPGEISGIVKGEQGYHIVKLIRRSHSWSGPPRDMIEREIRAREMHKLLPELRRLEAAAR